MSALEEARQACIDANEQALIALEKLWSLEPDKNPITYKQYIDSRERYRIDTLILKGELPKPTKKKTFRNGLYL
jgi:hypothetical protein